MDFWEPVYRIWEQFCWILGPMLEDSLEQLRLLSIFISQDTPFASHTFFKTHPEHTIRSIYVLSNTLSRTHGSLNVRFVQYFSQSNAPYLRQIGPCWRQVGPT